MQYQLTKENGLWVLGHNELGVCNLQFHKPYLAIVTGKKKFEFLPRIARRNGDETLWYYNVEWLKERDLVMAAGGKDERKVPYRGQVMSFDKEAGVLELYPLDSFFFTEHVARSQLIQFLCAVLKGQDIDTETIQRRVWDMTLDEFLEMVETITSNVRPKGA